MTSRQGEPTSRHWYLVSYDIRDAKRWREVHEAVRGYGERVQYSLFRCHLTRTELEGLRWQLERILADDDDLMIVHLCQTCASEVRVRGSKDGWDRPVQRFEIL